MQQQLQQALNLLNNKELFKLLPQLTSMDQSTSNNENVLLQKLLENLITASSSSTTGTVPGNFLLSTTATTPNNNNNLLKENNQQMNRFAIIPEYQFNLSDMTEGNKAENDLLTNGEHNFGMNPNQQHTPSTTTYGQQTQAQAPVVQVIHMPVSTNGMSSLDLPATVNRLAHWPYQFDQHGDQHTILIPPQSPSSLSKYLASASSSYSSQQQKSKFNNDNRANMTAIQANNRTISESSLIVNDNNTTMAIVNKDANNHDDKNVKDDDNHDKKINFSYHPILDYIVN
ncbi:hypothetical protein BLA29_005416 [Euroglyphus maynei]|uniref:Uncharacterized protein n=1 Tax=Euroglyphus maynei TaxID=6958 RepID=A0A1Y3BPB0_EURMA|nr:hypothetical protein BLA29_005416 [Euroglyphus maynei]